MFKSALMNSPLEEVPVQRWFGAPYTDDNAYFTSMSRTSLSSRFTSDSVSVGLLCAASFPTEANDSMCLIFVMFIRFDL
jgi:hypothetical protein